jgi:hypothetical protein
MKKSLLIIAVLITGLSYSCKKKSEDPAPSNPVYDVKKSYEKRWNVSSASTARNAVTVKDITFIEFTKNLYFAYFNNGTTKIGSYKELNSSQLQLDSLGVIQISLNTADNFNFELTDTLGVKYQYTTNAATPISTSNATNKLARTWLLEKYIEGDSLIPQESVVTASFSAYGTYLVKETFKPDSIVYSSNTWQWVNDAETSFYYGSFDGKPIDTSNAQKVNISYTDDQNTIFKEEVPSVGVFTYYLKAQ